MGKETVTEVKWLQEEDVRPVREGQAPYALQCRHHWVIESPRGATSMGVCKLCGSVREFRNGAPDALWEGDSVSELSRWGSRSPVAGVTSDDDGMSAATGIGKDAALMV